MTEPSTAAFELEPPTSSASSWKFSVEVADDGDGARLSAIVPAPIVADTCLSITSTTIPMPTPAPLGREVEPARDIRERRVVLRQDLQRLAAARRAPDRRSGCWLISVPALIEALVVMKITSTITEPLTAAPPVGGAAGDGDRGERRQRAR